MTITIIDKIPTVAQLYYEGSFYAANSEILVREVELRKSQMLFYVDNYIYKIMKLEKHPYEYKTLLINPYFVKEFLPLSGSR